jgi:predicted metal-dependent hydrolase
MRLGGALETVPARLQRWLEAEALRLLSEDLAFYCSRAGQALPQLRLSRAQRRWGSCSGRGCIRINWRLVQAPDAVRRSVVAHEVAHLVHFDHSAAFHALLREIYEGDLAEADAWLRREGRGLYSTFG